MTEKTDTAHQELILHTDQKPPAENSNTPQARPARTVFGRLFDYWSTTPAGIAYYTEVEARIEQYYTAASAADEAIAGFKRVSQKMHHKHRKEDNEYARMNEEHKRAMERLDLDIARVQKEKGRIDLEDELARTLLNEKITASKRRAEGAEHGGPPPVDPEVAKAAELLRRFEERERLNLKIDRLLQAKFAEIDQAMAAGELTEDEATKLKNRINRHVRKQLGEV